MENNIFDGAKFGDIFLTNDNRIAKFICTTKITEDTRYCLYVENEQVPIWYNEKGEDLLNKEILNIASRYQEPIDEEKLNKLSKEDLGLYASACASSFDPDTVLNMVDGYVDGFKVGFKKANEIQPKWYDVSIKPDEYDNLIFMTDMGFIFQGEFKENNWYRYNEHEHKMYCELYDHPECIIKWMKL